MSIMAMDISSHLECEYRLKKITPPTLALFCLLGMLALRWIVPLGFMSNWLLFIFGLGLMVLGIVMAIGAEGQFR
jgi:hypothetical protein